MRLSFCLNMAALVIGFLGALVMGFFPPEVTRYAPDGSPIDRLLLESPSTKKGRVLAVLQRTLSRVGPILLALGFALQLVALWLSR